MKITEEFLQNLYQKVYQVVLDKYNEKADRVILSDKGYFEVEVDKYSYGPYTDNYTVSTKELEQTTEERISERIQREEQEREEEKIRIEKEKQERERIEKEKRRAEYFKLKKEFE